MSRMLARPPAKMVNLGSQPGPLTASQPAWGPGMVPPGDMQTPRRDLGRQTFGVIQSLKSYGAPDAGRQGGSVDFRARVREFVYTWFVPVQVNPAHEQPKLIYYSGAQPFTVGMSLRRFSRTFMSASPRFQGRWFYIGTLERQYTERGRLKGMPSRQGTTYAYPRFMSGPRAIPLGGQTGTGGPPGPPYSPPVYPVKP